MCFFFYIIGSVPLVRRHRVCMVYEETYGFSGAGTWAKSGCWFARFFFIESIIKVSTRNDEAELAETLEK